jgi:hypothetical protein
MGKTLLTTRVLAVVELLGFSLRQYLITYGNRLIQSFIRFYQLRTRSKFGAFATYSYGVLSAYFNYYRYLAVSDINRFFRA